MKNTNKENKKPNTGFLYRGNDIIKIWEQYLKKDNLEIKFYSDVSTNSKTSEKYGEVDTLFNMLSTNEEVKIIGLSQNKEVAIVLNKDSTPYKNKDGKTITLCGEINYQGNSASKNIENAIQQVKNYNSDTNHSEKITNHIIIFPYHPTDLHWNLGVIELTVNNAEIVKAITTVYDPYGFRRAEGEKYIINSGQNLKIESSIAIYDAKQQKDFSSCGAITGENGKQFLKKQEDRIDLLKISYDIGAEGLRKQHIEQIASKDFNKAQKENKPHNARGDEPIENQFRIIHNLKVLIEKSENQWVKDVLPQIIIPQNTLEDNETKRTALDIFKQFLIQFSSNNRSNLANNILKSNGELRVGAEDLISSLAQNIQNNNIDPFEDKPTPLCESQEESPAKIKVTVLEKKTSYNIILKEDVKHQKVLKLQEKLEKNDKLSLNDFELSDRAICKYEEEISKYIIGESNNLLFSIFEFKEPHKIIKNIDFDISDVHDSGGNNILHHAFFRHDLKLMKFLLLKAKLDGIAKDMLNYRNLEGTTPLGMIFTPNGNFLGKIKIATELAANPDYKINNYLNTKWMDCINSFLLGGKTLLHMMIHIISDINNPTKQEIEGFTQFFKVLQRRNSDAKDEDLFNPDYPTMNSTTWEYKSDKKNIYTLTSESALFTKNTGKKEKSLPKKTIFYQDESSSTSTDYHMISTSLLIDKLEFKSQKIQSLCKKYFKMLQDEYEIRQFEDSSGDSEEEGSSASEYKQHLLEIDNLIKEGIGKGNLSGKISSVGNATRTFDHYKFFFGKVSPSLKLYEEESFDIKEESPNYNQEKWDKIFKDENKLKGLDVNEEILIPLFHGVPFMKSQYTNHERREVVKAFIKINQKLIAKHLNLLNPKDLEILEELSDKEKVLLEIHSRTATASAGIQSLYEMINANKEQLKSVQQIDNKLHDYFATNYLPTNSTHKPGDSFNQAMQIYVFNFANGMTKTFWEKMQNDPFKKKIDNNVIKYRFPVIATSKTPDHPAKFAIGNNVEENVRGEMAMKPDYMDGKPMHRATGLLYVTLHKLKDLQEAFNNHTAIDINRTISLKAIKGRGQERIQQQLECDFLGKMKGEVVAVIPIIYPHIRIGEKFKNGYHQAIWGINPNNFTKDGITNPTNIRSHLNKFQNPDVANTATFGKMLIPSIVNLANGIVLAVTNGQKKFPCSITEDNDLIPYKLKFEYKPSGSALTYMHRELKKTPKATDSLKKAWQEAVTPVKNVNKTGLDFDDIFSLDFNNNIESQKINTAMNNNIATFNQKIDEVPKFESKEECLEEGQNSNQTQNDSSLHGENNSDTNEDYQSN